MRALTLALSALLLPIAAQAEKKINGIGTNFAVYDATGIDFSPSHPPDEWYLPARRLKTTVGLYNMDPAKINSQLIAMRNSGQTDIAIPIWIGRISACEYSTCNDGVYDGQWGEVIDHGLGELLPHHKQNYVQLLNKIKALGFKRIIIKFISYWPTEAISWDESRYQEIWQFIYNTKNLTEDTVGTSTDTLYDLGAELGGLTSGVNAQFTKRLWGDYISVWGPTKTVGFSFAWAPGRFTTMRNIYGQVGPALPPYWAFDIYPQSYGQSSDMRTHLQNISNEMGSLNAMPIIILETWQNDQTTASDIEEALNGPSRIPNLNIDALFQWSINKERSLMNFDKHFSHVSIGDLSSILQISNYRPLIGIRSIAIKNGNSSSLVISDVNCATTSSLHCTVNERWSDAPNGKIAVITLEGGGSAVLHACETSAGQQDISWIASGTTYHFVLRHRTSCAIGSEAPVAASSVTLQ